MEIKRQKFFGREDHGEQEVNIVFGVDAPYVPMMGVCMTSIIKNNPTKEFFSTFFWMIYPSATKINFPNCALNRRLCG